MSTSDGDDLLALAARALREETHHSRPLGAVGAWEGMRGWRDVSQAVRRAARRRRTVMVVVLQLVLAVVGVGAWAGASGRLPILHFLRTSPPAAVLAPDPHRRATISQRWSPGPPAPIAELDSTPPAVPTPEPRHPAVVAHQPRVAERAPAAAPPAPAVVPVLVVPPDPDELYRQAHRAHFVLRDPAVALALWDRYLAAGGGSLTVEARYNRAIALVRLHRREDAIAALAPFAAGEHAGYRQEEAQALLRLLEAAAP